MPYHLASAVGAIVGRAIANEIHNSRQRAAVAHWHSPLSRLGRCGIFSLRMNRAAGEVRKAIDEAGSPSWHTASGLRLTAGDTGQLVTVTADWASVIEVQVDEDCAAAVRLADDGRQALAERLGPDRPVYPFVCLANSESEPRELPAPSGAAVAVTGLPWLSGLLRNRLGPSTDAADPVMEIAAAQWRADTLDSLTFDVVQGSCPQGSWVIRNLLPDDRIPETIDLTVAGPTGVFVIAAAVTGDQQTAERVCLDAARVRSYLPHTDVIPVIVSRSVTAPRFGPADNAGYPIAWLPPEQALEFLGSVRRRGLALAEIGVLNAPAPGWSRQVSVTGDAIHTRFKWC
jgi:hypothetical protein